MNPRMPVALAAFLALLGPEDLPAAAAQSGTELARQACRAKDSDTRRPACYDRIGAIVEAARNGKGGNSTDTFVLETQAPSVRLVGQSDAILVGTLKDAAGNTLQNLHLAGQGTLQVSILAAGGFKLTVSAPARGQPGCWLLLEGCRRGSVGRANSLGNPHTS